MLKWIADYFGVSVDYLLESDHTESIEQTIEHRRSISRNRLIISILATSLVWLIATLAFVGVLIFSPDLALRPWLMFIYAIPVSATVALVFNSIWGRKKMNYPIISVLVWSVLLAVFMSLLMIFGINVWPVFILGIPGQVIIIIWSGMVGKYNKKGKAVNGK